MTPATAAPRPTRPAAFAIVGLLIASLCGCGPAVDVTQSPAPPSPPTSTVPSAGPSTAPTSTPVGVATAPPMPSLGPIEAWVGRDWHRSEPDKIDGAPLVNLFLPHAADGQFVAMVESRVIAQWLLAYSSDGRAWHFGHVPEAVQTEVTPMAFGNGEWLALTYAYHYGTYDALRSADGRSWDFVAGAPLVLDDGSTDPEAAPYPADLTWHRGFWYVLVGQAKVATDVLYRSVDGVDWSPVTSFPAEGNRHRFMESDGTTLVVTEPTEVDGAVALTTADGDAWEQHRIGPLSGGALVPIEAARGRWIALEWGGPGAWWSLDGKDWYPATLDGDAPDGLFRPIVLADGFLALDGERPWASSDGRAWAPVDGFSDAGFRVDAAAETRGLTLLTGYRRTNPVVWTGIAP